MGIREIVDKVQEVLFFSSLHISIFYYVWAIYPLLTFILCSSFDELLELSQQGDSSNVDMLVGDIYGGMDYSKVFYALCHLTLFDA